MKRILMCPPNFYDIEYEINPWMRLENKVDKNLVEEQYDNLKAKYFELGCEILEINPEEGLPDMVYSANYGHVQGNLFIPSNFKFPQRRKEADFAENFFAAKGFAIKKIPGDIFFEGQGDLLEVNDKYFLGYGKRSDLKAKAELEKILNVEITELEVTDPYYYHLDTCFAPISKDIVVINPQSFHEGDIEKIAAEFTDIIKTNAEDNNVLGCNLVVVGKNIVVGKGISNQLKENFRNRGYTIHEVDMSEYLKGGGSVKCCSLELWD